MCWDIVNIRNCDIEGHQTRQTPTTEQEFIHEHGTDSYCRQAVSRVGLPGMTFNSDRNGLMVCTAPIAGAVQKFIRTSLQLRLLYNYHCPTLAGHPSEGRVYDSMQREYYWLHIANEVYTTVRVLSNAAELSCQKCDVGPYSYLRLVAIAICRNWPPGNTPEDAKGKLFHTAHDWLLHEGKTTDLHFASIFLDNWLMWYGIFEYDLTGDRAQFINKFSSRAARI